jgi:hypothetical protein
MADLLDQRGFFERGFMRLDFVSGGSKLFDRHGADILEQQNFQEVPSGSVPAITESTIISNHLPSDGCRPAGQEEQTSPARRNVEAQRRHWVRSLNVCPATGQRLDGMAFEEINQFDDEDDHDH